MLDGTPAMRCGTLFGGDRIGTVQITRDGSDRIVIPKSLRQQAGLEAGELHCWVSVTSSASSAGWALYREIDAELAPPTPKSLQATAGKSAGFSNGAGANAEPHVPVLLQTALTSQSLLGAAALSTAPWAQVGTHAQSWSDSLRAHA